MHDHPQLTIEGRETRSAAPPAPPSAPGPPDRLFAAPQTMRGQLAIPDAPAPRERTEGQAAPDGEGRATERDAAAAHPVGSTVTTTVHAIGGRSQKVTGRVVGHKRGQVRLQTDGHGTLAVDLDKIEG